MARYFFHLARHGRLDRDDTGVELPSAEAALEEALKAARGMTRDAAIGGTDVSRQSFEVADATGSAIFTFPFSLAPSTEAPQQSGRSRSRALTRRPKRRSRPSGRTVP
jgi:hypothetical protein